MASELRPELRSGDGTETCLKSGSAYFAILNAVETQPGLVHGRLHSHGEHCAIGSFFDVNTKVTLPWEVINEVAAVNDSMPSLSKRQRKLRMVRWLRWRLKQLGMPGYERSVNPHKAKR